ncbi:tetratricopeptide repeat protein [bacterium]|nr:tetratricopeptide repeat protein [bacterium]
MKPCPTCSHTVEPDANFCSRCGARLLAGAREGAVGDRRVVTVLFADVSGFTAMSEQLDPEAVTEIINQCFAALTAPIYRYGGVVDKYIGDAVMAIFGAPIAHEDDPDRAVSAALAMQEAAQAFAADLEGRMGFGLKVRIGLNTGLVVAGEVGGAHKREYTVMGDAVNLAQRLEAAAEPGSILVSEQTYRLTCQAFSYRALSPLSLKGKRDRVAAFELLGRHAPGEPRRLSQQTVGRERERAALRDHWLAAQGGVPQWVTLLGEAGVGKTHLVDAFMRAERPGQVLAGRGVSYHQDRAFELVRQLLEAWLGLAAGAHPSELSQTLAKRLGALDACKDEDAALIALLWGVAATDAPLKGVPDHLRINAAVAASIRALITASRTAPLLLVVEDVQWVDAASWDWLEALAKALAQGQGQLMVLAQARPGTRLPEDASPPGLDRSLISVRPLGEAEATRLASSLTSEQDALSPQDLDAAVRRSEGNPMVLKELVRSLIEGADLEAGLSPSLKGLVAARLDRLPAPERELLEVAAVIGRVFDPTLLRAIAGTPQVEAILLSLTEREWIRPSEPSSYAFSQAIVHEVVYYGMLQRKRRDLHRRVAQHLEHHHGTHDGQVSALARHFLQADEATKAFSYLQRAASLARLTYANDEARTCLREAIALLDRAAFPDAPERLGGLLFELAEVETTLGEYAAAQDRLVQALALSPVPTTQTRLLQALGGIHERRGAFAAALESYEQALGLVQPGETLRASLLVNRAWLRLRGGDHAACLADCNEALASLSPGTLELERARALSVMGIVHYRQNRWSEARSAHAQALEARERAGDLAAIASSLNNLGMVESDCGAWAEAEGHYQRSLAIYQRIGDQGHVATVLNNQGDLAARRGAALEAERQHREALEIRKTLGDRFGIGASLCALGEALRLKGDLEQARAVLFEGLGVLEAIQETELIAEACAALGDIALAARAYPEADRWHQRAMGLAAAQGDWLRRGAIARSQAQAALELGDLSQARTHLDLAESCLAQAETPLDRARHLLLSSRLLRAEGRPEEAKAAASEGDRLLSSLGVQGARETLAWQGETRDLPPPG